jgi:hypothetical protein
LTFLISPLRIRALQVRERYEREVRQKTNDRIENLLAEDKEAQHWADDKI